MFLGKEQDRVQPCDQVRSDVPVRAVACACGSLAAAMARDLKEPRWPAQDSPCCVLPSLSVSAYMTTSATWTDGSLACLYQALSRSGWVRFAAVGGTPYA